jgi:hypothetical protein
MLVDARWPPPENEPEDDTPIPPRGAWPFLMVALLAAGYLLPPLLAYACLIGALYCAVESLVLLLPGDGLRNHKQ